MQILAITQEQEVVALEPQVFGAEVKLQDLIRDHPRLLLASSDAYADREIWTVGYEVPTPAGAVDLLMLDSTGEVWVVETKLRKNPEVKKQVIGQVLAYASCVAEWTGDQLAAIAERYLGRSLEQHIAESIGPDEAANIVAVAAAKLAEGDLTCVVVVDELPTVLQRAVEFVNDNADFTILALQIEVVEHEGTRFVVPTVTGATVPKTDPRTTSSFDNLYPASSDEFKALIRTLDKWASDRGYQAEVPSTSKSKRYITDEGDFILRVYPAMPERDEDETIEISVHSLHDAGMLDEAEGFRTRLRELTGRKHPSAKQWQFPIIVAVEHWDDLLAYVDDYLRAKRRARSVLEARDDQPAETSEAT